jgi:hypothetical protein
LDGGQQQPIMSVTRGKTGSFTVKTLTFQHGLSTSDTESSAALNLGTYNNENVTLDLENNIFIGNAVAANSEADVVTLITAGSITALNNVFVDNNLASGFGWLITSEGSASHSAIVNNNTISGNSCSGTTAYPALSFAAYSPATAENNIIVDNPMCSDAVFNGGGSFIVEYNDLGKTYNDTAGYGGTYQASNNLAGVTPNFVGNGSYQLSGNSPLVDAGSNSATGGVGTSDAAGHARIVAIRSSTATVDIGAYELQDDIFKNGFE